MKTVIIGATPNPSRYAYLAAERLENKGHEIIPVGNKVGEILGHKIINIKDKPELSDIHTVTMYVGADHFKGYEEYVLGIKPKRIIFNPGAENDLLESMAQKQGIETVHGCTLVMLGSGQY